MQQLEYPFDAAEILQKKRSLKKELVQTPGLVPKKIAIVGGSTVGEVRPMLELFLLNLGIQPEFWEGGYGLYYENVVFDDGSLRAFAPDVLYIHTSGRNLRLWPTPTDPVDEADRKLEDEFARFEAVWQAAKKLGCPIVQNNFEQPGWRNFGNLDAADPRGRVRHVNRMNERMAGYAAQNPGFYIHDFAWLAGCHGLDNFCAEAAWYAYKYACAPTYIPYLGHSLAALIGSLFGRSKKGVVCDLDNTLWGGVIGEVGPEGVELGSETPTGMAYTALQEYLATLAQRGILLTIASKNEEANARAGLERPDSVLHPEDFLRIEANWEPKSQSIANIAASLNIGTDSLVFIDDNPAEREEVRRVLPQVVTPPVCQPENSVHILDRTGYFEATGLSADDVGRAQMYRQNARRDAAQQSFADYDDYLRSLGMSAEIVPFSGEHLERITQLINKTNQFNLTTRRYTATEVQHCMESAEYITLSGRLVDKFGDNGITSVIIGCIESKTLHIELWVMSCRVFKRGFEHAMFDALMAEAMRRGLTRMEGLYIPTAKNLLVQDFYATIGFDPVAEQDGTRSFERAVPASGYEQMNTAIEVE